MKIIGLLINNESHNSIFSILPVADLAWGVGACRCVLGREGLPLPFCSEWSTDVPEPERRTVSQGGVSEIFQCSSVYLSVGCKLVSEISTPRRLHLSLTLSSCLSRSLCCLCSTFLCMSTRLRIVLSLSIAETGSLARSRSISMASLSAGLRSTFTTGDGR